MKAVTLTIVVFVTFDLSQAVNHAKELYSEIGSRAEQSKYSRPVREDSNTMITYIGITLIQIMDLDEKSKIITLSVCLRQIWKNKFLSWSPSEYGGINSVYLPHSDMWLPDIVLFNNADGKYETQFPNKPILYSNGMVDWTSPAIFQSICEIDVRYYPYDEQICFLNFGSWTYNKDQVKVRHVKHLEALLERANEKEGSERWKYLTNYSKTRNFDDGVFLTTYYKSGEWDLMQTPAVLLDNQDQKPYDIIKFGVKIRRKILFYNLNLILPMIGMSLLAALIFYLPFMGGERIESSVTILLTITVFFVLMADELPPTSLVIPLINQYLIISFLLITVSVVVSVIILDYNHRLFRTHKIMSPSIRRCFLEVLPRYLFMERPPQPYIRENLLREYENVKTKTRKEDFPPLERPIWKSSNYNFEKCFQMLTRCLKTYREERRDPGFRMTRLENHYEFKNKSSVREARDLISEISGHIILEIELEKIRNDWKYAAMVMDRLILFIFCFICFAVAVITCLNSPILYDHSLPINETLYNDSNLNTLLLRQL